MVRAVNEMTKFYRRLVAILGGGVVVVIVLFLVVMPWIDYSKRPAFLDILVEPVEAEIEIDGQKYQNAVYAMEPGTYTAKVTLADLVPITVELNLEKNRTFGLYMRWSESEGWKYDTAEELARRNTIGEIMPLHLSVCGVPAKRTNCDTIEITYENACKGEQCIVITGRQAELSGEMLNKIKEELKTRGYNLDDYQYTYVQDSDR